MIRGDRRLADPRGPAGSQPPGRRPSSPSIIHGSYLKRGYGHRDQILVRNRFDPSIDLRRNAQGVWELTGNKPRLRDELRQYFIQRDEDNPNENSPLRVFC